ncbi:carbohydrate ABC transporter permease, partial [Streptomyces sp. NPDC059604]
MTAPPTQTQTQPQTAAKTPAAAGRAARRTERKLRKLSERDTVPHGMRPTRAGRTGRAVLLTVAAIVTIFPFYAMVVLSLKPSAAVEFPGSLVPWPLTGEAYDTVMNAQDVPRWLFNTLVYSVVSVVGVLLLASLAGYAFAKKRFPGREAMFWSFLSMV